MWSEEKVGGTDSTRPKGNELQAVQEEDGGIGMSDDAGVALRRWWLQESAFLLEHLRKGYRVGALDEKARAAISQCTSESFRAGWSAAEADVDDSTPQDVTIETALRKWWLHESSALLDHLKKGYRVGSLDQKARQALSQCTGDAFRAGWKAAKTMLKSRGKQPSLFDC